MDPDIHHQPSPDEDPSGDEQPPPPQPDNPPPRLPHPGGRLNLTGIGPTIIRTRQFPTIRHGFDPAAVQKFLNHIADELAALQRELVILHQENERLKRALRDWQTAHSARLHHFRPRQPRPRWPMNP